DDATPECWGESAAQRPLVLDLYQGRTLIDEPIDEGSSACGTSPTVASGATASTRSASGSSSSTPAPGRSGSILPWAPSFATCATLSTSSTSRPRASPCLTTRGCGRTAFARSNGAATPSTD